MHRSEDNFQEVVFFSVCVSREIELRCCVQ